MHFKTHIAHSEEKMITQLSCQSSSSTFEKNMTGYWKEEKL